MGSGGWQSPLGDEESCLVGRERKQRDYFANESKRGSHKERGWWGEVTSRAGWVTSAGKGEAAASRLCGAMQIQSSGPQSKASSFILGQRCALASKMEIHRYVPAVRESSKQVLLTCFLINPHRKVLLVLCSVCTKHVCFWCCSLTVS